MAIYLASQKSTFETEKAGGYLWAPPTAKNGKQIPQYEFMKAVKKGDYILHVYKKKYQAISVVKKDSYRDERPKGKEYSQYYWTDEGWKVEADYYDLDPTISKFAYCDYMKSHQEKNLKDSCFDKNGNPIEAYLRLISKKHAEYMLKKIIEKQTDEKVIAVLNDALKDNENRSSENDDLSKDQKVFSEVYGEGEIVNRKKHNDGYTNLYVNFIKMNGKTYIFQIQDEYIDHFKEPDDHKK